MKTTFAGWILLAAATHAPATATAAKPPTFKTWSVADLQNAMRSATTPAQALHLFDANAQSTRENVGLIPGAKTIGRSSTYDIAQTLPADKKAPLVFYCANHQCTSSHTAAERAIQAGYSQVAVMIDGIYGWRKSGAPLEPLKLAGQAVEPKWASEMTTLHQAVIVDVREDEERHITVPGALWMPMSKASDAKAWSEFTGKLPKDKAIVFYCAAGVRSKKAAGRLAAEGFKTAYFDSADQWAATGLPVEKH